MPCNLYHTQILLDAHVRIVVDMRPKMFQIAQIASKRTAHVASVAPKNRVISVKQFTEKNAPVPPKPELQTAQTLSLRRYPDWTWRRWDGKLWHADEIVLWRERPLAVILELAESHLPAIEARMSISNRDVDRFLHLHYCAISTITQYLYPFQVYLIDGGALHALLVTAPRHIRSRLEVARSRCRSLDRQIFAEVSTWARIRLELSMHPHNPSYFKSLVQRDRYAQGMKQTNQDRKARTEAGKWVKGSLLKEAKFKRNVGSFHITNDALWTVEPLSTAIRLCLLVVRSLATSLQGQLLEPPKPYVLQREQQIYKALDKIRRLETEIYSLQFDLTALRHYRIRNFPQGVRQQEIILGRYIYTWLGWRSALIKEPRYDGLSSKIRLM